MLACIHEAKTRNYLAERTQKTDKARLTAVRGWDLLKFDASARRELDLLYHAGSLPDLQRLRSR